MADELLAIIQGEIGQSACKAIPFARFMELALYHPRYGYYMSEKPKVGKEGDFFTSATVHPVFAETLADAVIGMWRKAGIDRPALVEAGGGTGALARNMVRRIAEAAPDLYRQMRLVLIESSPYHRRLQQEALAEVTVEKCWYDSVEAAAEAERVEGVVVSNEWFDAFPVHLVERHRQGWREVGVGWDSAAERLVETYLPALTDEVARYLEREPLPKLPAGTRIELNLGMRGAVEAVSRLLARGYVITIDYGDTAEDLYHPSRRRGTLMCYYRHQAIEDPFVRVGEQDMTAHVNFSALMKWGEAAGLAPLALMRQDQFLIKAGILHKAQAHNDRDPFTSEAMKRNRAIQQLILPGGMGGVFRVLIQSKEIAPDERVIF